MSFDSHLIEPKLPDLPWIGGVQALRDGTVDLDWFGMARFWKSYRGWLAARGFRLHKFNECPPVDFLRPPENTTPSALPFARRLPNDTAPLYLPSNKKIIQAQDNLGRDVTIKLVDTHGDEYQIYQRLLRSPQLFGDDFPGVLPPVAILDTPHPFSLVVMPTWGDSLSLVSLETIGQVIDFMQCALRGLCFLHSHHIAHRDIDDRNIMTDYYSFSRHGRDFFVPLSNYRRSENVHYCLLDFDVSVIFPQHIPLRDCRLPTEAAMEGGSRYGPFDMHYGEYDYDPFAYDVACLGNLFRTYYAEVIPIIPLLAPLFDKMTTNVVSRRFSARDALIFLEEAIRPLPASTLAEEVEDACIDDRNRLYDLMPTRLSELWGPYKTPQLSWMRRLTTYTFVWEAMFWVRRTLRI